MRRSCAPPNRRIGKALSVIEKHDLFLQACQEGSLSPDEPMKPLGGHKYSGAMSLRRTETQFAVIKNYIDNLGLA